MQQIQESVLRKIHPGAVPVFIISPNINDGATLALLLSNHLVIKNLYKVSGKHNNNKNYFFSEEVRKLSLKTLNESTKKHDEYRTSLKFIFDKGFDNKHLWGLQLDYKLFFELEVDTLFPNALFIFQYGSIIKRPDKKTNDEEYIRKVYKFVSDNSANSILLHLSNALYTPEIVLKNFAFDPVIQVIENVDIKNITNFKKVGSPFQFHGNASLELLKQNLDDANFINNYSWFKGNEVLFIIVLTEHISNDAIAKKAEQFIDSFITPPAIHIVCKSESEKRNVQRILTNMQINTVSISISVCYTNIPTILNEIIQASGCTFFVIDNAVLSFSLAAMLLPLKTDQYPGFVFGNLIDNKLSEVDTAKLQLVDILTVFSIPTNIAFRKQAWSGIGGFDNGLPQKVAIWDFAIRSLITEVNYAYEVTAVLTDPETISVQLEDRMIPFDAYKPILDKHKDLYEEKLNQVVKIFSENQYIPHTEIKKLHHKIGSLQSLLTHSKDELRSLNAMGKELQQRIHQLEGRWHFKLANKVDRIRKIFFKKKTPGTGKFKKILKFLVFAFTKPGFRILRKIFKNALRRLYLIAEDRKVEIVYLDNPASSGGIHNYHDWINKKLDHVTLKKEYDEGFRLLKSNPKISIVMPVYDPPTNYLKYAIESVTNQLYGNWELCIADDCSPNPQIKRLLEAYALKDSRIKVVFREENGHISASSNSALALATGDYILFMDHDDLLTSNCCYEVAKYINNNPENNDIIYSDEDKVDGNTYLIPHFKPDWAPDNLLSRNYFGHVVVMKKQIVDEIKGFRLGFEGSQDYDLILRATELSQKIGHIPKVLYHWRIHEKSAAQGEDVKPYAYIAAKKALEEALIRRDTPGEVKYLSGLRGYQINYDIVKPGKVSIIIPTKDHIKLLQNTIDSIIEKTTYTDYEIIVLNNNSVTTEFFDMMDEYRKKYPLFFQCIDANIPFNFSKLMNIGVSQSKGDYILLLNNDVEIIHSDWLTKMVSFSQQERIGAVGVKLLYPDDNIQHAGVIIGLGGVAGHAFVNNYKDDAGYFNYIQSTNNYSAVTAACLMVRKNIYLEVGCMDEKFEVEYNDVDFCLNIMDHGYNNVYLPDVELYHYESATRGHPHQSKESYERHVREIDLFKAKWDKYIKRDPYYNPNLNLGVHDFSMDFSK